MLLEQDINLETLHHIYIGQIIMGKPGSLLQME